jgi:filamentous hemagglutinin
VGTPQSVKYPQGVDFDLNGYPRFEKYAIDKVDFDFPTKEGVANGKCLSGNYQADAKLANAKLGYSSTPNGYVWHHVEDMTTMILVPQDLHSVAFGGVAHSGGASLIKAFLKALQ